MGETKAKNMSGLCQIKGKYNNGHTSIQGTINFLGNGTVVGTIMQTNKNGTYSHDLKGTFNDQTGKLQVKHYKSDGKTVMENLAGTVIMRGGSVDVVLAVLNPKDGNKPWINKGTKKPMVINATVSQ